ncbi:pilus assembly PilX N-terminal domain-containing protein [Patescibacteria group bacterium]|nr:pilus assembly PilX N-terminal domain-containing protein [Patescibacteria group bacterium]MBU1673617.1 pilus assembly PilX N-terminal domain-containing protein [Patescibacteria group bacterium]MBU1963895.1 pilus assembly PilX N-terminal domain-containing protein [Patescibacteria group bacterium]
MKKNEQGSIIVITVIIMFVISAIAISLIFGVINSIRSLTVVLDSTKAYYAAETGLERSLYEINQERLAKGLMSDALATSRALNENLDNNSSYEIRSVIATEDNAFFDLEKLEVAEVDYFDPDNPTQSIITDPASQVDISWDDGGDCASSAEVEISVGQWQEGQWAESPDQIFKFISTTSPASYGLLTNWVYRVRARPLNCGVKNLEIQAYVNDATPDPPIIPIYGQIGITSLGQAGKSQAALQARTTWNAPVYSLYDFALFSECDIIKTGAAPSVLCP